MVKTGDFRKQKGEWEKAEKKVPTINPGLLRTEESRKA